MNKKLVFAAGFVSGQLVICSALALKYYQVYGGFGKEAVQKKAKEILDDNEGIKYFDTLFDVVNETHPELLEDPRLVKQETNLQFKTITNNFNKEGDDA